MTLPQTCIYCAESDPTKFAGREHVIPQAFGKFGAKTPVLKSVCDVCNALFGKDLDQVLARQMLEGVLRYKQGIFSSEKHRQTRLRFTLADEDEAGPLTGALIEGIDPTNDELLALATQLRIKNLQTGKTDTYTRAQVRSLTLTDEVYGTLDERKAQVFASSKEEYDAFAEELEADGLVPNLGEAVAYPINPKLGADGKASLGVHIEAEFDQLHRRALAKILVNFATYYLGEAVVCTPEWNTVRRFVRYAEGELGGRLSDKPFWTGQETDNLRFEDAINIRIENQVRGVVGIIQFYNRITYELLLVENHRLEKEIAARFLKGHEPELGYRGTSAPPTSVG